MWRTNAFSTSRAAAGRRLFTWPATGAREVVGIDISKTFIDDVVRRQPASNARFLRGEISRLDEIEGLTGQFDIVLLLNALG